MRAENEAKGEYNLVSAGLPLVCRCNTGECEYQIFV